MGAQCPWVLPLLGALQTWTAAGCHLCNQICGLKLTLLLSQRAWRLLLLEVLFKLIKVQVKKTHTWVSAVCVRQTCLLRWQLTILPMVRYFFSLIHPVSLHYNYFRLFFLKVDANVFKLSFRAYTVQFPWYKC